MIDTYKSLCSEFYDLDKPEAPPDAVEFYLKEIIDSEMPLLEPMCGSGRFLVPFLERGFNVEGTDASAQMLEKCKKKLQSKNLKGILYYEKLQELKFRNKYMMAFIPSGSFGLITDDEEIKISLKKLFECLKPGGKLLLEISTPSLNFCEEQKSREVIISNNSKIKLTSETKFDFKSNIEITNYEYSLFENNELKFLETETIKVKHYYQNEFRLLLEEAGFSDIKTLKPYSGERAAESDEEILFKCIKAV